MVNIRSLREFVINQIPKEIIEDIINGIIKIYETSHSIIFDKYPKEQALDLLPHYRRAEIEAFLMLLSNKFPQVITECKINESFTNYHVEVKINQIVLTLSFCTNPSENVRSAKFRNNLSQLFNKQIEFDFDGNKNQENIENENQYYAILKHGAESREPKIPQFFLLHFPSQDANNIADPIDLMKLYNISPTILLPNIEDIKFNKGLDEPTLKRPAKTEENNNEFRSN